MRGRDKAGEGKGLARVGCGEWTGGLEASRGRRPYPSPDGDGDRVRWRPASAAAGSGEQRGGMRPGGGGLLGWAAQMTKAQGVRGVSFSFTSALFFLQKKHGNIWAAKKGFVKCGTWPHNYIAIVSTATKRL